MNFIKLLPLTKSRLDVLLEIYTEKQDYLRNISKKLKMNPSLTSRIIHKLHKEEIINKTTIGKENQYSLNKNYLYTFWQGLLEEYHLEKILQRSNILKTMTNLIINNEELIKSSEKIYIFGSYAAGNFEDNSDIDLLFISENRKLIIRSCREISLIVGKSIVPVIYTQNKFNSDLSSNEPFLSSIINNVKNRAIIK